MRQTLVVLVFGVILHTCDPIQSHPTLGELNMIYSIATYCSERLVLKVARRGETDDPRVCICLNSYRMTGEPRPLQSSARVATVYGQVATVCRSS